MSAFITTPYVNTNSTFSLSNSKTLSANLATATVPVFGFTGTVRVTKLYGIVTTTLGANHTGVYLRLNDQTTQINLTLNTVGSTLSAFGVGAWFGKTGLNTLLLSVKNNNAGVMTEALSAATLLFSEFTVIKKLGAATNIEYIYSTTDTPTSGVIQFFCEYQPLSSDGAVAAL